MFLFNKVLRQSQPLKVYWFKTGLLGTWLTAAALFQQPSPARANTPPPEARFAIAFLSLPDGQDTGSRKRWNWTSAEKATGAPKSEGLGPFLTEADLTSIKLTLNANKNISHIPEVSAGDKDFVEVFSLLRRTSKLDILAVAPSPTSKSEGWRYFFGRSDAPTVLRESNADPTGRAQPWQVVLKILSSRGYNAFALPSAKGQIMLVSPNPALELGTQVAVFKDPTLQKAGKVLAGVVELRESRGPSQFLAEVLVAENAEWQPRPWTPAYVESPAP